MIWALVPNWLKKLLVAAGALLVAVGVAFLKGRKSGIGSAAVKAQKENSRVEQKFNKIDSQPVDFDAAVDRLRKRAGPAQSKPGLRK